MRVLGLATVAFVLVTAQGCSIGRPAGEQTPDPAIVGSSPIGIPASDLARRDAIREAADPLYAAARNDAAHFDVYSTDEGGLWRIVVRYVQGASLDNLQALVPAGAPVEWVPSRYSWADLRRIQDEIGALGLLGTRISTVGVDSADNAVMVETPVEDPELQRELTPKYGDAIRFRIGVIPQPL